MFRIAIIRNGRIIGYTDTRPFWPNRIDADGMRRGVMADPGAFLMYDAS